MTARRMPTLVRQASCCIRWREALDQHKWPRRDPLSERYEGISAGISVEDQLPLPKASQRVIHRSERRILSNITGHEWKAQAV